MLARDALAALVAAVDDRNDGTEARYFSILEHALEVAPGDVAFELARTAAQVAELSAEARGMDVIEVLEEAFRALDMAEESGE